MHAFSLYTAEPCYNGHIWDENTFIIPDIRYKHTRQYYQKNWNISTYFVMSDKSLYPRSLYIKVWLYYSSFYFHAQPSMFDSLYSQSALPEDTIATCKHLQLRTTE